MTGRARRQPKAPSRRRQDSRPVGIRTRELELDAEWKGWLCENLLGGASDEQLVAALASQGVPSELASREIRAVRQSPLFRTCQRYEQHRLQLAHRARVLTALRKLGNVERVPMLSEEQFFGRYYASNTPVVLTEAMHDWPALERWTPEYFRDEYGDVAIEIVEGRDADPLCDRRYDETKRTTTMGAYAERVLRAGSTNDFYFTARNNNIELAGLAALQKDVRAPPEFFQPRPTSRSQSFWFGPKGSTTATHHDPTNILFCQVYGRKRIRLAPPLDLAVLALSDGFYHRVLGDPANHEELRSAALFEVELSPGEALFIPALWWHRVEALSISISYSLLHFKRQNSFDGYQP